MTKHLKAVGSEQAEKPASHARKRTWTPDVVRGKIRGSMVANRLIDHALGKADLSTSQVRACEVLLRKIVPDLSATEIKGHIEQKIISAEPLSADAWEEIYAVSESVNSTH